MHDCFIQDLHTYYGAVIYGSTRLYKNKSITNKPYGMQQYVKITYSYRSVSSEDTKIKFSFSAASFLEPTYPTHSRKEQLFVLSNRPQSLSI